MDNAQLVKFKTPDHLFLPGLLYEPTQKTKKVALYLHGNGSSSIFYSVTRMNAFAQTLNDINVSFFPFNNRGANIIKSLTHLNNNGEVEKVDQGMAYELIKDSVHDIEGAIEFLTQQGYDEFYLIGLSTGANKIVLYNYLKPKNKVSRYILLAGGDDTGIYYKMFGSVKFRQVMQACKQKIKNNKGREFISPAIMNEVISYQSLYDTINPDGDYNIFPYYEYLQNLKLSTKELFREYKTIHKPTLVIYGEQDEYCDGMVPDYLKVLQKEQSNPALFSYKIVPNADHSFTDKEETVAKLIASWLAK